MLWGDVKPNPGPVKNPCSVCKKAVAKNHRVLPCASCGLKCHIGRKCANISAKDYKEYNEVRNFTWFCPVCCNSQHLNNRPNELSTQQPKQQNQLHAGDSMFHFPKRGFSLFHLNCRSLFPKIDEIRAFAASNPFHILSFSETWLNNAIAASEVHIQGYSSSIRCDREIDQNRGGGVAAYIRDAVPHKKICYISNQNLEALAIRISPI